MGQGATANDETHKAADIIIVGGGLSGGLIAWRLQQLRPELKTLLIENGDHLGGDHTWSFHGSDITPAQLDWLAPLISYRWASQTVRFPQYCRDLSTPYLSISSAQFDHVLGAALADRLRLGAPVSAVMPGSVTLQSGETLFASAVIDCRGPRQSPHMALGFQKFVGLEIELANPHGLVAPIIMDARVDQKDGYRFVYVLPFDAHRLLVEDTRYADGDQLDEAAIVQDIGTYVDSQGWTRAKTLRKEQGVLPIALAGDIDAFWASEPEGIALGGMRAGLFHPLTGYSLPDAVALADAIAYAPELDGKAFYELTKEFAAARWRERGFFRLLTRMLFLAAKPSERYKVLERFYKMRQPLIERFYAARPRWHDKARLLAGKPPVPISKAFSCLDERNVLTQMTSHLTSDRMQTT